jgi:threonyl-tRNA synthetase
VAKHAKLGIGPPVENGFYYDFEVPVPFSPDDLKAVEGRMRQIVKQGQRSSRRVVTEEQARDELSAEPYKQELIGLKGAPSGDSEESVEVGGPELTIYDNVDPKTNDVVWKDLCRGPHLPDTRHIPAGDDDVAADAVSFRYRTGEQKNGVPIDEAVSEIVAAVESHTQV